MEHSNYHLYEAAIITRDSVILAIVALISILFLWLVALEQKTRIHNGLRWLMMGGYYVSLVALFIIL